MTGDPTAYRLNSQSGTRYLRPCIRGDGFKFFFYSREMNEPPHVHVTKGDGAAKLWLDPPELEEIYGFNANERRAILRIVAEYQHQLLKS